MSHNLHLFKGGRYSHPGISVASQVPDPSHREAEHRVAHHLRKQYRVPEQDPGNRDPNGLQLYDLSPIKTLVRSGRRLSRLAKAIHKLRYDQVIRRQGYNVTNPSSE